MSGRLSEPAAWSRDSSRETVWIRQTDKRLVTARIRTPVPDEEGGVPQSQRKGGGSPVSGFRHV